MSNLYEENILSLKINHSTSPVSSKVEWTNWHWWCSHLSSCEPLNLCVYIYYNDWDEKNCYLKHKHQQMHRKRGKGNLKYFCTIRMNDTLSCDYFFSKTFLVTDVNVLKSLTTLTIFLCCLGMQKFRVYENSVFDLMSYGYCS